MRLKNNLGKESIALRRFCDCSAQPMAHRAVNGSVEKMAEEDKSAELLKEKANNYFKGNSQYL